MLRLIKNLLCFNSKYLVLLNNLERLQNEVNELKKINKGVIIGKYMNKDMVQRIMTNDHSLTRHEQSMELLDDKKRDLAVIGIQNKLDYYSEETIKNSLEIMRLKKDVNKSLKFWNLKEGGEK